MSAVVPPEPRKVSGDNPPSSPERVSSPNIAGAAAAGTRNDSATLATDVSPVQSKKQVVLQLPSADGSVGSNSPLNRDRCRSYSPSPSPSPSVKSHNFPEHRGLKEQDTGCNNVTEMRHSFMLGISSEETGMPLQASTDGSPVTAQRGRGEEAGGRRTISKARKLGSARLLRSTPSFFQRGEVNESSQRRWGGSMTPCSPLPSSDNEVSRRSSYSLAEYSTNENLWNSGYFPEGHDRLRARKNWRVMRTTLMAIGERRARTRIQQEI